ncbi:hypothetical protein EMIHUDRAFT_122666 [Emiliania huxleyi CCMP1516]|uniref:Uncharacterized protein n=2 Tax=Emiliania huxleyi TaxID=2903 RepID=A0A0D3KHA5_EMIH1|nr:hypothetical protein EMIHUDRAFT_122666 [Emiliania huxleyi CCMP1516]EOD35140.1 hypothetical protein EMIHUDRAFT_122666 [Emiliania huxleyi CCMP1516]|eukprot:XP_005787569.1 hypothetical protein EMIHUDRAFT_122666 [Emiliania huxleyi CCMP1516]
MRGAGSREERHTSAAGGQLNAKQLNSHISNAGSTDALLTLFDAHSASLDHIHAANLWNKLGKQRIERRHEGRLEQLVQRTLDLVSSCDARALANVAHGVAKSGLQARVVHPLVVAAAEAAAAAELAAYFSPLRRHGEVEVMHVAKRGGRVGQLKDGKKIGLLTAHPERAALLAREAQDEQGWPV